MTKREQLANNVSCFLYNRKLRSYYTKSSAKIAPRGEEVNASHTARARKCAAGAHFILKHNKIKEEQ